jgi:hypothetical protein
MNSENVSHQLQQNLALTDNNNNSLIKSILQLSEFIKAIAIYCLAHARLQQLPSSLARSSSAAFFVAASFAASFSLFHLITKQKIIRLMYEIWTTFSSSGHSDCFSPT